VETAVPKGKKIAPQDYHGHKKDDRQQGNNDKIKKNKKILELQETFSFRDPMLNSMIRDREVLSTARISQNPAGFGEFSEKAA
jgi:hypothetical protein